jgi:AcrB/AcrD/AcrF family
VPVRDAAVAGARQRFRAVLMTAFTFILGVVPLVAASGAGAASRRAIGTTLFGGMLAATLIGIFLIPALYAAFQIAAERLAIGAPRWPAERGREPARVGIDPPPKLPRGPRATAEASRKRPRGRSRYSVRTARHPPRQAGSFSLLRREHAGLADVL